MPTINSTYVIFQLTSILITIITLIFSVAVLRGRRAPGSVVVWITLFVLVPYLGLPAYLILGRRKLRKCALALAPITSEKTFWTQVGAEASCAESIVMYADGVEAFHALEKAILGAKTAILFETFIFKWDESGQRIFAALLTQARNGVQVRLLLDGFGQLLGSRIAKRVPKELREVFQVGVFSPALVSLLQGSVNLRNHRKLVVIDGEAAFVGGMNIASEYMGPSELAGRWRDFVFVLKGAALQPLMEVFSGDWRAATRREIAVRPSSKLLPSHGVLPGTFPVYIAPSGPLNLMYPIYDTLIWCIANAQQRITIATPYFVPDETLIKILGLATVAGKKVQIILPEKSNHILADLAGRSALRELQNLGVELYFYPKMIHAKIVSVDGEMALIGSANMDIRSLFVNYELGLWIKDQALVSKLDAEMAQLQTGCHLDLLKTGPLRESLEGFVRILSPLL